MLLYFFSASSAGILNFFSNASQQLSLVCSCNLLRICCKGIHSAEVPPWKRRPSIQRYLRRHFENKRGVFWDTFLLHLSYELHAMFSINKMLSCHAHFVLYLLQEIEFILSRTTSCICHFCRIERLYGSFPYSCICRMNFFRTTDTTIWKPGLNESYRMQLIRQMQQKCVPEYTRFN